jgi:hypothetical protein
MKIIVLLFPLLTACAFGAAMPEEDTYGHSNGPGNDPGVGSDNLGPDDNESPNGLSGGCLWETIIEDGQITNWYILCPSGDPRSWLNIPDPAPEMDKDKAVEKRR